MIGSYAASHDCFQETEPERRCLYFEEFIQSQYLQDPHRVFLSQNVLQLWTLQFSVTLLVTSESDPRSYEATEAAARKVQTQLLTKEK